MNTQLNSIAELKSYCRKSLKPIVVILIEYQMLEDVFNSLASRIDTIKIQPIIIYSPQRAANLNRKMKASSMGLPFFCAKSVDFSDIEEINVAVISDIDFARPAFSDKTKVIACPHYFAEYIAPDIGTTLNRLRLIARLFTHCDALFISQAQLDSLAPDEWSKLLNNLIPEIGVQRRGAFSLIKGGYLKADLLHERISEQKVKNESLVIAPTTLNYPNLTREQHIENWISMLTTALKNLPNIDILFRFHPRDWDNADVLNFIKQFCHESRVTFDTQRSNLTSFTKAKLYLTNASAGRITFSLATGLPHVVYCPSKKIQASNMGFVAYNKEDLGKILVQSFTHGNLLRNKILNQRDQILLNCGKSFAVLLDSIEAYCMNENRSYWISFEREYVQGDWEKRSTWKNWWKHTELPAANAIPDHVREFVVNRFPNNPPIPLPCTFAPSDW